MLTSKSVRETEDIGRRIGALLQPADVVCLFGDLGSGKTCFVRGVCRSLCGEDEVSSPTFTIINEYSGKLPVYHFDFYRLENEEQIFDLGYEEYFYGEGVCLIEWAERAPSLYPKQRIEIYLKAIFEKGKESWRRIHIRAFCEEGRLRDWEREFEKEKSAFASNPASF
ncbi:MAG: tRNA (adenosine(37)-N6)-threonylcarbamoyltransferase complex ATPase subunit type 1 TsaE [Calditrichaeota bacterium]|nr:tRNA (adenosine(37)-N6)-threonylcarbamoyltransferase complex ATPase subunit type 1 TsaE [Calditrichota bacterium]